MKYQSLIKDFFIVTTGTFILVVSVAYFILPFNILSGGVAGIAVAVSPITGLSEEVITNVSVVVLFIFGAMFLGKNFTVKTIYCSIMYPVFLSILMRFPVDIQIEPLLASVYAGVLAGIGVGLVFRVNASTGGMDVPVLILNKWTKLPIPTLMLVTDALTVCLGWWVYGIEAVLIGLISVYSCTIVIDKILVFGSNKAMSMHIISDYHQEIANLIHDELDRGCTMLQGYGGYTSIERPVLLCVVDAKQYPLLMKRVQEIDSQAFIIASEANEVRGNGFHLDYRV